MRVLIFVDDVLNITFGVPLEMAAKHLRAGDAVEVVVCRGALFACPSNSRHDELACRLCQSKLDSALAAPALAGLLVRTIEFAPEDFEADLPEFTSIEEMKRFALEGANVGMGAASSVVTVLRDPRPDLRQESRLASDNLRTSIALYRWFRRSLPLMRPDRVYLFNGRRSSQMPVLLAAQEFGCEFVTYEIGHDVNKYLLVPGTFFHDLDHKKKEMVRLWREAKDTQTREFVGRRFFKERRFGSEQQFPETIFKKNQVRGLLPRDFSPRERNVVIFNSSEFEFTAVDGYENPVYANQMVGLETIINDSRLSPDIRLWLRVHPHLAGLKNSQSEAIARLDRSRIRIIGAEEAVDTYALMEASEKVLTFGSTMSIEAAYAGVPSILVGREVFEYGGSCYTPASHDEVIALLNDPDLKALPIDGALMFGHFMITRDIQYRYYDPKSKSLDGHPIRPNPLVRLEARLRWWHPLDRMRWWLGRKVRKYLPQRLLVALRG